jgi:hypothetical protein
VQRLPTYEKGVFSQEPMSGTWDLQGGVSTAAGHPAGQEKGNFGQRGRESESSLPPLVQHPDSHQCCLCCVVLSSGAKLNPRTRRRLPDPSFSYRAKSATRKFIHSTFSWAKALSNRIDHTTTSRDASLQNLVSCAGIRRRRPQEQHG